MKPTWPGYKGKFCRLFRECPYCIARQFIKDGGCQLALTCKGEWGRTCLIWKERKMAVGHHREIEITDLDNDIYKVTATWFINTAQSEHEALIIAEKLGVKLATSVESINIGRPSLAAKQPTGPVREDI